MRIKELREAVGMTQAELAKEMAVDQSTVSYWEKGRPYPQAAKLLQLADLFGCTIDALFGREPPGPGAAAS